ncbi:30S ribosomal protein S6 [Galactobacillus timonensis]|uniref:30S ribosomal protein S6 n=1 Tax=Galactobacillus timonensis TaxID=2041840 RepID=UPI00240A227A|nr:30S ribosomal protein S6 [Galactobacillus timonensis]MDD5851205.1 30S ribosomal protein S6 [Galactobacillus timonensis]MDD6369389.1 30S ribosomal protein S6 [Galactobacillus timonensis]
MSKYEVMYIVNANVDEDKRKQLIADMANIITSNGGKVTGTNEWGMRDFAYEIDDMTKGYYVVVDFESNTDTEKELDRLMRINGSIVRHMIVNTDDAPVPEAK